MNKNKPSRRGRLILRNLSFKATEESLREVFSKYGELNDVNIPLRDDGKNSPFGFVQYVRVNDAANAINEMHGKHFLNRRIAVDWAVPKDAYTKHVQQSKQQANNIPTDEIKLEDEIKEEDSDENEIKEDKIDTPELNETKFDVTPEKNKIKKEKSNDVKENKTIFIRNIPFDAKDDDLKNAFLQFGPIEYARVVYRKDTDHSAGTGFVKFKTIDSANICLNPENEIKVFDLRVYPMLAIARDQVAQLAKEKIVEKKVCTRNLYLLKEGLILSGSSAAEGLSSTDMQKRLELEKSKNELLKNLARFVSKERLIIHNIPLDWDQKKLIDLVVRETKLQPKECRIQRNIKCTPEFPQGTSKGFGFVSFTDHDSALLCLRRLNNNPNIWGKNSRPIVSFSIENKRAIEVKRKRLESSKRKNPNLNKPEDAKDSINKKGNKSKKSKKQEIPEFSGMTVNPKNTSNIRKNSKINEEMVTHQKNIRKNKKSQSKLREKMLNRLKKRQNIKANLIQRKQSTKHRKKSQVDALDKVTEKHKIKLEKNLSGNISDSKKIKKKKWYMS